MESYVGLLIELILFALQWKYIAWRAKQCVIFCFYSEFIV